MRLFSRLRRTSLPKGFQARLAFFAIHCVAFSVISAIWVMIAWQLQSERQRVESEIAGEAANLTVVFEQNIIRTASELDRILLFLRSMKETLDRATPWQQLIKEQYTVHEQALQISVVGPDGIMITSTAMLYPKTPVDLSDRESFQFHKNSSMDTLHIGKPLIGRASGLSSIHFTRRLKAPDGTFGGMVVISLDPSHLSRGMGDLRFGIAGGVAIVGTDDIIRSGVGRFERSLGSGLRLGLESEPFKTIIPGTEIRRQQVGGYEMLVANRRVAGYLLEIFIGADGVEMRPTWASTRRTYILWGLVVTVAMLATMIGIIIGLRRQAENLMHLAKHDPLTSLSNRFKFQEHLERAIAEPPLDRCIALYMIDLDGFKSVNDAFGHPVGDKLLVEVAERLREVTRETDLVARLGGDEFAVVNFSLADPAKTELIARRLCERLAEPFVIDGQHIQIGGSIGVSLAPTDATTVADLVRQADIALYCAKVSGRGTSKRFTQAMDHGAQQRRQIEVDLKVAVEKQQFELFYQPIMCLATRRILACEALIRWRHPEHGMIPPIKFIPIAEEIGLISEIGAWVIRHACMQAAQWPDDIKVAVNVSARQLSNENLLETIVAALKSSGLDASRLEIEITESMILQNDGANADLLERIRDIGVSIAIDDFGTGYSSLSYLNRFPIDSIKIDRSFLMALETNEKSISIIKAIVAIANTFGMRTVAEGVERQSQLDLLAQLGCTDVQGYFIGKPAPEQETLERLATWGDKYALEAA